MMFNRLTLRSKPPRPSKKEEATIAAPNRNELESPINGKERFLKQLDDFRAGVDVLNNLMTDMESAHECAENLLVNELKKNRDILQARDSAIKELEESFNPKIQELESQLREKEQLLKIREEQVEGHVSEVNALTGRVAEMESANERAEILLQSELSRKEEMLRLKDSAARELKENLSEKIQELENLLSEKDKVLRIRDERLGSLSSEVHELTERLAETESAKERAESLLQDELRRREEMVQVRDSANRIRELRENLNAKIQNRENQVEDKDYVGPFEILLAKS